MVRIIYPNLCKFRIASGCCLKQTDKSVYFPLKKDTWRISSVILLNEESVKLTQFLYLTHVLDYLHKDPQDKTLDLDYTRLYSLTSLQRERLTVRHKRLRRK
jgi:hypothetical protein